MLGNVWRARGERREIPGPLEDGETVSPLKGIYGIICGGISEILSPRLMGILGGICFTRIKNL